MQDKQKEIDNSQSDPELIKDEPTRESKQEIKVEEDYNRLKCPFKHCEWQWQSSQKKSDLKQSNQKGFNQSQTNMMNNGSFTGTGTGFGSGFGGGIGTGTVMGTVMGTGIGTGIGTANKPKMNVNMQKLSTDKIHCSECFKTKNCLLKCKICQYTVCWKCSQIKHEQVCNKLNFCAYYNLIAPIYCNKCEKASKTIQKCVNCEMKLCNKCKKITHSTYCAQPQFQFYQTPHNPTFCNICNDDNVILYIKCKECKMKICFVCRKNQGWE